MNAYVYCSNVFSKCGYMLAVRYRCGVHCTNNHLTYERTEQHAIFTYQTSSTQFLDAPEDGPVGPKHVELSNILLINIQPEQQLCILLDYICNIARRHTVPTTSNCRTVSTTNLFGKFRPPYGWRSKYLALLNELWERNISVPTILAITWYVSHIQTVVGKRTSGQYFVQVHRSHDVASTNKWQMFATYTSRGNEA